MLDPTSINHLIDNRGHSQGSGDRVSERGIYGPIPGCQCTYEDGDSDCAVHPRCTECGADLSNTRLAERLYQWESIAERDHGAPIETVEKLRSRIAELEIEVDAYTDAATPAFDEIAALCGCPEWEYPGQVIRDVQSVVTERDSLRRDLAATESRLVDMEIQRNSAMQSLAQRDKDWDALMIEIALTVGDKDDREAAENGEVDELDPWHALRRYREGPTDLSRLRQVLEAAIAWKERHRHEWLTDEDAALRDAIDAAKKDRGE